MSPLLPVADDASQEARRDEPLWGWMAEFASADALVAAARAAYDEGYRRIEAYSPFPVDGLAAAIGSRSTRVPAVVFVGALLGAVGGYLMQW